MIFEEALKAMIGGFPIRRKHWHPAINWQNVNEKWMMCQNGDDYNRSVLHAVSIFQDDIMATDWEIVTPAMPEKESKESVW